MVFNPTMHTKVPAFHPVSAMCKPSEWLFFTDNTTCDTIERLDLKA